MHATHVIIVGGGPAGAACAWQLQRNNIPCLVLDRAAFPRLKPCAGWVTPDVFKYLELPPEDYPHSLTTFSTFNISLRGLKFRLPTHQYGIRRIEFDTWLLARAGTEVHQHQVERIEKRDGLFVVDERFSAPYIVGAAGTHCPVRRTLFTTGEENPRGVLIITKEEEFTYAYNDDRPHLWFFDNGLPGYGWYFPKSDGTLNVGIGGGAQGLKEKGQSLNEHWIRLIDKIDHLGLVRGYEFQPRGYSYTLRRKNSELRRGNALLVGDALGLATKDMGEGIGPAIYSGLLAADAIIHNRPYEISAIPRYSIPSLLRLRR